MQVFPDFVPREWRERARQAISANDEAAFLDLLLEEGERDEAYLRHQLSIFRAGQARIHAEKVADARRRGAATSRKKKAKAKRAEDAALEVRLQGLKRREDLSARAIARRLSVDGPGAKKVGRKRIGRLLGRSDT